VSLAGTRDACRWWECRRGRALSKARGRTTIQSALRPFGAVLATLTTACYPFLALLLLPLRSRLFMQLEILALQHQLTVHQRSETKRRVRPSDWIFWAWLSRVWRN